MEGWGRSGLAVIGLAALILAASCGGGGTDGPIDRTPPEVVSVNPGDNATQVPINTAVTVTFSEAVDPATVDNSTFLVTAGSDNVPGTVSLSPSGLTATFTPSTPPGSLAPGTVFTVRVTVGVRDLAGNPMAEEFAWSFSTDPVIWVRQFGTDRSDFAHDVAADGQGNVYVTGDTYGSLYNNASAGGSDFFIAKYDSTGNKLWLRQHGSVGDEYGTHVAVDGSGNIYMVGETSGSLDNSTNAGSFDAFLVKYDPDGNRVWTRQFGSSAWDYIRGVAVDNTGNIYVSGSSGGSLDNNAESHGIFLAKYDPDGNRLWLRQFGSDGGELTSRLVLDRSGNAYVVGSTTGSFDNNTNAGEFDIVLVKCDPDGNRLWTRQYGSALFDHGIGVSVDSSGNIFVSGFTSIQFLGGAIDYDKLFLIKVDSGGNMLWEQHLGAMSWGFGNAVDGSGNVYVTGTTHNQVYGSPTTGGLDLFLAKYDPDGNKLWLRQYGSPLEPGPSTKGDDQAYSIALGGSGNVYVVGSTRGDMGGNTNAGLDDAFLVKFAP